MSIARSLLTRGTGVILYNSVYLSPRDEINVRRLPSWETIMSGMFGPIDAVKKDLVIKIPLKLWGAYENLSTVFPSYLMNPIPGTSVFGASDTPLVIQARNNDRITYPNAQITKLSNLYLGTDSDFFSADVEFSAILKNSTEPEASGAYSVYDTNSYADATIAFAKTNFTRTRFVSAWGSITGFTAIKAAAGIAISWDARLEPAKVDGYGTVDMTVMSMIAQARMVPLGPTLAQLKTNSQEEAAMGTLASTISADLVSTGNNSGPVITLKSAYLKESGTVFDAAKYRFGEALWETTRGFASGAPAVVASAA